MYQLLTLLLSREFKERLLDVNVLRKAARRLPYHYLVVTKIILKMNANGRSEHIQSGAKMGDK